MPWSTPPTASPSAPGREFVRLLVLGVVPQHERVRRLSLFVILACGCGTTGSASPEPSTPATPNAAPNVATTPEGRHAIDSTLVATARSAPKIEKMKLRTDESGALVKQSLYHHDAGAVPEAVKALAAKTFPGATVVTYETERYGSDPHVFEVEVDTTDGKRCEVSATAHGELRYQECRLDPAALPKPVADKVAELYPGAKVLEAESKVGPGIDELTVEVEANGRELYLRLSNTGDVLSTFVRIPAVVEVPI